MKLSVEDSLGLCDLVRRGCLVVDYFSLKCELKLVSGVVWVGVLIVWVSLKEKKLV